MKKMLFVFALVACATVLQAVSLSWTTSSANPWGDNALSYTLVYSSDVTTDLTSAINLALGTETTSSTYSVVVRSSEMGSAASAVFMREDKNVGYFAAGHITPNTTDGTYFIVFTDANGNYAASYVNATDAANSWIAEAGALPSATLAPLADFTGTLVPEPTALALLALGVAGLALRRRA